MSNEQEVNKIEKVDLLELQINLLDSLDNLVGIFSLTKENYSATSKVDYDTSQ